MAATCACSRSLASTEVNDMPRRSIHAFFAAAQGWVVLRSAPRRASRASISVTSRSASVRDCTSRSS
jgi:hypothetical protein